MSNGEALDCRLCGTTISIECGYETPVNFQLCYPCASLVLDAILPVFRLANELSKELPTTIPEAVRVAPVYLARIFSAVSSAHKAAPLELDALEEPANKPEDGPN